MVSRFGCPWLVLAAEESRSAQSESVEVAIEIETKEMSLLSTSKRADAIKRLAAGFPLLLERF